MYESGGRNISVYFMPCDFNTHSTQAFMFNIITTTKTEYVSKQCLSKWNDLGFIGYLQIIVAQLCLYTWWLLYVWIYDSANGQCVGKTNICTNVQVY